MPQRQDQSIILINFKESAGPYVLVSMSVEFDLHEGVELGDVHFQKLSLKSFSFEPYPLQIVELVE